MRLNCVPLVTALAMVIMLVGCDCSNEQITEHRSPDGNRKFVSFSRECGATTGPNFQISVLDGDASTPSGGGNAFVADDDHGKASFVARAEWTASDHVLIHISKAARIFKQETSVDGVHIDYVLE